MSVRPFALVGASDLAAVQRTLQAAVQAWCGEWGVPAGSVEVDCARAWDGADSEWRLPAAWCESRSAAGKTAWLGWRADWPAHLQRVLFAPDSAYVTQAPGPAALASGAAGLAHAALLAALTARALTPGVRADDEMAAPAMQFMRGSGALLAHIRLGKHVCSCLLDHAAVRALAGRSGLASGLPPLPKLQWSALLGKIEVKVPVEIGSAEVGLGGLMTLGVGDVIRLNTLVVEPLRVAGPDGARWFEAYLGKADDMLAIEVAHPEK